MQVTVNSDNTYTLTAQTDAIGGAMQDTTESVVPGTATKNQIAAITDNTFSQESSEWGIGAYNGDSGALKWYGLDTAATLKTGGNAGVDDVTTVLFGIYVDDEQAPGVYAADVTFIATAVTD